MILHIGGDTIISVQNIVAIIDIKTAMSSKETRKYINQAKEEGQMTNISEDPCKSYIITMRDKKRHVYLSPISTTTLLKRSGFVNHISM